MFDLIVNADIPADVAKRYKYSATFLTETGQKFTIYRHTKESIDRDMIFYGVDKLVSFAERTEERI